MLYQLCPNGIYSSIETNKWIRGLEKARYSGTYFHINMYGNTWEMSITEEQNQVIPSYMAQILLSVSQYCTHHFCSLQGIVNTMLYK